MGREGGGMTTPPLWYRPPRGERYRISGPQNIAHDAWYTITGNTSATYGELVALARLGADVQLRVGSGQIMAMDGGGVLRPIE